MKRRLFGLCTAIVLLTAFVFSDTEASAAGMTVSLRIEGTCNCLYENSALIVAADDTATLEDVVASSNSGGGPLITVEDGLQGIHITEVDGMYAADAGELNSGGWMATVNGKVAPQNLENTPVSAGDDIVIFYGDTALMQYPQVDISRMLSDGVVRFTSSVNTASDSTGNGVAAEAPIAGATVHWDGMAYKTDDDGEIIIDSTGAGVRHTVQIERYADNGLPTVLRFATGYSVIYYYSDVSSEAWYDEAVIFVSEKGLLNGVSKAVFLPDGPMNRAMFVAVLGRMANAAVDQEDTTGFSDVVSDGWSTGYIAWAVKNGLVNGCGDGTFGQYNSITREQIAQLLYRFAQSNGFDTSYGSQTLAGFMDAGSVAADAQTAMLWAVSKGIITGSGGCLEPAETATRAQAAAMLQRYITQFYA